MTDYRVTWKIDVEADNPTEAALRALIVQRDRESTATVFRVEENARPTRTRCTIDLSEQPNIPLAE